MASETPQLALSRLAPARRVLIEDIAAQLRALYPRGRVLIGVDGPTGAGKTTFADDLAVALRASGAVVLRASMDDFLYPRARRWARGRESASGRYEDSYDYELFRRVLVGPFQLAGSTGFQLAGFDAERDVPRESEWTTAPADAVLVVDGGYLNRPGLRGMWHSTIWVDARVDVRQQRLLARDGIEPGSTLAARYDGAFELYRADGARDAASTAVDNSDPSSPTQLFTDSC